jgi:signal transduction histidine kinase
LSDPGTLLTTAPAVEQDRWPGTARKIALAVVVFDAVLLSLSLAAQTVWGRYAVQYGSGGLTKGFSTLGDVLEVGLGALIVIRRPRHPVGWLLLAAVSTSLLDAGAVSTFVIYAIDIRHRAIPGGDLVGSFEATMWLLFVMPIAVFLPLIFPTGKLLSRRWRLVVWVAVTTMIVAFIGSGLSPNQDSSSYVAGVHPISLPQPFAAVATALPLALGLLPVLIALSILALVLRYRRGSADERHQVKWLAVAIAVAGSMGSTNLLLSALGHSIPLLQDLDIIGIALIPVAAAIAVLRYRLYDIDVVISRTVVYGSLAAFITAVYVGIVVGVGTLVGSGGQPNLLLSIVATGIVAVAFQPVRERLQKVANRLVYGRRATPYEVLSQFSERVAETYAGDEALPRMARVLAEGTGAERADVWLRAGSTLRQAASWPEGAAPEEPIVVQGQDLPEIPGSSRAIGVRHQGELLGALAVTKRAGESMSPIEQKLLDDLGHQAGLVLKNVGLTSELLARLDDLRASRQRLVAAQDQERRRLERDLHDGAQQNLVAIKVKLGLAEMFAGQDPGRAKAMLIELASDADDALDTLRDLARGIYPPLLADQGLKAALSSQARKATLPVQVEADGIGRYSQDIEAAVYFCCLEALQNVQKYAGAASARVQLATEDGHLTFAVSDDGAGFDRATVKLGSGLQNMTDRLEALGGRVDLSSAPGRGTTIEGRVPAVVAVEGPQPL